MKTEEETLSNLNKAQLEAVTHKDGPLLVVAGAGTGKTSVITRRIAWLINQKLAQTNEILALTFTDKAAGEMEVRVDQLLPYGYTDVAIATFHSFGDHLLRRFALDLGLPPEFRILASDEQEIFLSERLNDIEDITELRPVNNPRKYVRSILRVISRAKDELISPDQYAAAAAELLAKANNELDQAAARRQTDIATIYRAYEDFKEQTGVIDFGDQIALLVQFLRAQPKVREELQAQYKYVLVDEFQDTNIAQYELVKLLLRPEQNITVVGDDDQAIYKFRGAAVSNILGFLEDFPTSVKVVLTYNYRSTQPILNGAYQLITHNNPDRLESTLGINKQLTTQADGTPPILTWYHHEIDELDGLVAEIKKLTSEGLPYNQIAILLRSNLLINKIAAGLSRADIPYTTSSDQGFIQLPEVRGLINFLKVLVRPTDSLAFMKLTLSPYYKFKPEWMLALNDIARKSHQDIDQVLHNPKSTVWQRADQEGKDALAQFINDIDHYRLLVGNKSATDILYQFLKDRDILTQPNKAQAQLSLFAEFPEVQRLEMIQNIAAIFDAIKRYTQAGRDPFVPKFVDYIDELVGTIVPPRVDLGPDTVAVQIMTVHAAKGLEFDTVFLPDLTSDRFPARRRSEAFELPASLIKETLPTGDEHLEEERRLAYVAMTRAKHRLYLSGAARTGEGVRLKKPSPFIFEALGITETPPEVERVSPAARIHTYLPIQPVPPSIRLPEYDGVLFLSPAMIDTYQNDPYNFYWRYVLKAPQESSRHLSYGNAVHAAIESYYAWKKRGSHEQEATDKALSRFAEAWTGEGFESKTDEARHFAHGQETVRAFAARAQSETLPSFVEEEFILNFPGVRIRGRMDAIFGDRHEIRDFKTSQVKDQKEANQKLKDNIPIRIYAIAYLKRFGVLPQTLTLDFVDHNLIASYQPTNELLTETESLIAQTVADIKAGKFDPNPSNPFKDYE